MPLVTSILGSEIMFKITGAFDSSTCQECLTAFKQIPRAELRRICFDIEEVEELPSCCLGLLRYLQELAQIYHFGLEIRNCSEAARELFELSGLEGCIAGTRENGVGQSQSP